MYVDKQLSDLKAVQTLSRLNRCHPKKLDTFVLDFANDPDMIRESFQRYYKTTILAGETDINKLNDLQSKIEEYNFYNEDDVVNVVKLKLSGNDDDRPKIDAILDAVTERFKTELDEGQQIECKSAIKNFKRTYPFIASIMPFESPEWEKLYIFLSLLLKKLPRLKIDDFTDGLLDTIDFDKYTIVKQEERSIQLEDVSSEVDAVPVGMGGNKPDPELDVLSAIVADFNEKFGNYEWRDKDEVFKQIRELPVRIGKSVSFINAVRNSDQQTAQIQFNQDMMGIVASMLEEKTEFVTRYFNEPDFQNKVNEWVYRAAYQRFV